MAGVAGLITGQNKTERGWNAAAQDLARKPRCWAVPKEVPETECETNYPVSDAEYITLYKAAYFQPTNGLD